MLGIDMNIDCFGMTDAGKLLKENEDQFIVADLCRSMLIHQTSLIDKDYKEVTGDSKGKILAVADGIAKQSGGREASAMAVGTVIDYVLNAMPWFFSLDRECNDELQECMKKILEVCDRKLKVIETAFEQYRDIGTTLTIAYILWPMVYVAHIGDSRCYLMRSRRFEHMTTDHTVVNQMAQADIDPHKIESSQWQDVLFNVIGGKAKGLATEFSQVELQEGDTLLLCTDGLTKHLSEAQIISILRAQESSRVLCERLVAAANDAGGSDNITVIVARCGGHSTTS
jgi:protein phosphatase